MSTAQSIRQQLADLEEAWNCGDVSAMTGQYHSSMTVVYRAEFWDYAKQRQAIETMMASDPPRLKLKVHAIQPLGEDYALANGYLHLSAADGAEQGTPFSVIYRSIDGQWKLIYSHS